MPNIQHSVQIDASPGQVYPLISSGSGFSKWWAEDVTQHSNGMLDLGFFNRATVYTVRLTRTGAPSHSEWLCLSGKEWEDTKLRFQLGEIKGQTLLRFTHADWKRETEYFVSCNTTWGALMFRLKSAAEGPASGPLFSKKGWAP